MNKLVLAATTLGLVLVATAADGNGRLSTIERKAKLDAVVNQRVGGFIERPGTAKGSITYVNCQQKAPRAWINESIAYFAELTKFKITYSEGAFDLKSPKVEGNATIFIIDDEALPPLLVAPESRWALVNIAPIAEEQRPVFFEQRTKKELSRAFAYLCGATGSRYERSLTRGITSQAELDKNPDYELPMDVVQRFWDYMKPMGVQPVQRSTYLKACQEGWAPQPTNDVQKAVWEKVHAIPDKPLTIEFDPKKGR
jgi:hypothetical protein